MIKKLALIVIIVLSLSACQSESSESAEELLQKDWSEIEESAKGTTVRMYMWGGDDGINRYMDEFVAPRLKEEHDITLERVPMDTNEILQKLFNEKKAGKEKGTIDVIWINGENFKNAKDNELLVGPFTEKLPNVQKYVESESLDIQYDFGTEVEGLEAPWGKVQFVYFYDEEKIADPPKSFGELKAWVKENPGRFTYPEAADFTGNAFLRHLLYEEVASPDELLESGFNEDLLESGEENLWSYLRDIKPYLWREGKTYPSDLTELDRLYNQGEVWMTFGYNEARAESLIKNGNFPKSTKSFIMDSGSIGNTHFLAVPFNSPNKAGAMASINYLLSPEAQLMKYDSTYWGENIALDPGKLSEEDKAKMESMDRGASVLPPEELAEKNLPEVDAKYVNWIKEHWINEVVKTD
ncbi:putative spermidine/putrescine transport system substrate-binding protein [Bacillus tianshenii]|uniref:Spermidine/putrescine transport system substrate-binding protein n=1 Tax=Sutcliffiella tianshenii TaxID=1463404 RepID=A0ABS2NYF0_9BACI|nr:ABC transporter substrate-binding protein [Bacillus tianshenii]MBM7619705.1 putative spermidine/putrescine transport system substrate-binding protein [Bacillus tianshenii]